MADEKNESVDCNVLSAMNNMELSVEEEKRLRFEENLTTQSLWGYSTKGLEAKKAAMTMLSTKTGMYARIPLLCKSEGCPYADTCQLLPYDMAPEGEYCPIETAQIELRAAAYSQDIDYDNASFTDRQMLNDLVGYDIMLERCRALMTKEGTPVIEIVAGVSDNGDEIKQPAVSKAWEAYEKISKKRNETYQLMLMTRKDRKKDSDDDENSLSDLLKNVIESDDSINTEE